jgi:hypothetical protein
MTSSETLYMKNAINELRFLLVTHMTCFDIWFGRYRILKSGFWVYKCLVRFLGHKMSETCWGLNTSSVDNELSFPTSTQTHIFDNRGNGYGRSAHVRSLPGH